MGERHHRYVWCDGSSKQSGGGCINFAETSGQRRPDEDMLREEGIQLHLVLDKINMISLQGVA